MSIWDLQQDTAKPASHFTTLLNVDALSRYDHLAAALSMSYCFSQNEHAENIAHTKGHQQLLSEAIMIGQLNC